MPAVRQVEALVAQWEIGNLLIPQRQGQAGPVVERRIDDLVAGESALCIRQRDMANLAAPAFHKSDGQMVGPQRTHPGAEWPGREALQLAADEVHGTLDLQPADIRAGED